MKSDEAVVHVIVIHLEWHQGIMAVNKLSLRA